ncbi:uncharacterized protein PAC_12961 [Phialocephala subalpina]|uniref:Uncharacterized protein n=1 Tax=Phialocephala subalpina TaxID=576137 RepID=A0A1L7XDF8_9HELO|nr:uncharacterized protein PAC_12961 [Phialocephala subalpina]
MKTWGGYGVQLSMQIIIEKTSQGPQMFAKFDFKVIEGVMRFERQATDKKAKCSSKTAAMSGPERHREHDFDEVGEESSKYGSHIPSLTVDTVASLTKMRMRIAETLLLKHSTLAQLMDLQPNVRLGITGGVARIQELAKSSSRKTKMLTKLPSWRKARSQSQVWWKEDRQ